AGGVGKLEGQGLVLGLAKPEMFNQRVQEFQVPLPMGSVFLLYTDGIVEAMDEFRVQYDEDTLASQLLQLSPQPAKAISDAIIAGVRKHLGNMRVEDDLTLVVLKRVG